MVHLQVLHVQVLVLVQVPQLDLHLDHRSTLSPSWFIQAEDVLPQPTSRRRMGMGSRPAEEPWPEPGAYGSLSRKGVISVPSPWFVAPGVKVLQLQLQRAHH